MLDSIIKFSVVKKSNKNYYYFKKSTNNSDYNLNKTFDTVYYQKINKRYHFYIKSNSRNIQILDKLNKDHTYVKDTVAINSKFLKMFTTKKKLQKFYPKSTQRLFV